MPPPSVKIWEVSLLYMEIVKRYIKEIISFAIGVLCTLIAFILYDNHQLKKEIIEVEKPIIKVETKEVIKYDTIYNTITKPTYITETIIRTDTIKADTAVKVVQREYYTEINTDTVRGEIKAIVSGVNPQLDSLHYNFTIPTKTITNEITIERVKYKRSHWNFTVGIGYGWGITTKKADVFIGGMVGYSF